MEHPTVTVLLADNRIINGKEIRPKGTLKIFGNAQFMTIEKEMCVFRRQN